MRKLIVSNLISPDGYFAAPGNDLSWFQIDPEFHRHMASVYARVDTILLGRKTYDLFFDFWPGYTGPDEPTADFINLTTKVVFSKTLEKAPWDKWDDAILFKDNLEDNIKKLKGQPGKDIVLFGSGSLVSALSQADLIDEYRFIINPVILGSGAHMFGNVTLKHQLKLKTATVLNFGMVILDYERDRES